MERFLPSSMLGLLLYQLSFTSALPSKPSPDGPFGSVEPRSSISCDDINECRKLREIVLGCIATVIVWTWVVLHPNIPPTIDNRHMHIREKCISSIWMALRHRFLPFVVTLMAPEWTLAWAIQQWITAKQIVQEGGPGWTMSHGFFVLMGGFHAYTRDDAAKESQEHDPGIPWYPLDRETVLQLVKKNEIELPLKEEIQDKSKTDWLGKSLALLQTGWFLTQCIARGVAHLPLSELEVVTLAYMVVNVWILIVWWHKPRSVDRPIRVFIPEEMVREERQKGMGHKRPINGCEAGLLWVIRNIIPGMDERHQEKSFLAGRASVPTFYPGRTHKIGDFLPSAILSPIIGAIFGAVHFIAWSYSFSSHTEQLLWRLSSAFMTGVPIFILATFMVAGLEVWLEKKESIYTKIIAGLVGVVMTFCACVVFFICPLLYGPARLCTFALAFKTLTSLPDGALHTVSWTKWMPHI